jgi:hypothetical protein
MTSVNQRVEPTLREKVEDFLYYEASLLDDWELIYIDGRTTLSGLDSKTDS